LIGLVPGAGEPDGRGLLAAATAGRVKLLWVFHHDLLQSAWPEADVRAAIAGAQTLVFQGTNANEMSAAAQLVLPSAAYAERDGTFTNFRGRVQRFRPAVDPLGEALADWQILARLAGALGLTDPPFGAERGDGVFRALADAVAAYRGMTY